MDPGLSKSNAPLNVYFESSVLIAKIVRVISFAPIEDFVGYMAATDIVLNLRYPTVGESSGSLLRALGLGRAVIVSDVGGFREFPDEVCLKAPVDATEEDVLFEYLNLIPSDECSEYFLRFYCMILREKDFSLQENSTWTSLSKFKKRHADGPVRWFFRPLRLANGCRTWRSAN